MLNYTTPHVTLKISSRTFAIPKVSVTTSSCVWEMHDCDEWKLELRLTVFVSWSERLRCRHLRGYCSCLVPSLLLWRATYC